MTGEEVRSILYARSYQFRRAAELIATGCSNADIAKELGCTLRTAKAYANRVYRTFGLVRSKSCACRVQIAGLLRSANAIDCGRQRYALKAKHQRIIDELRLGKSNGEIATILSTTENVIKNRMRELLDLSGMGNRVELANWAAARTLTV
jgi:DNA-binding NarL/FixJ family response regulator